MSDKSPKEIKVLIDSVWREINQTIISSKDVHKMIDDLSRNARLEKRNTKLDMELITTPGKALPPLNDPLDAHIECVFLKAINKSENVRKILETCKEEKLTDAINEFVLVVNMGKLIQLINQHKSTENERRYADYYEKKKAKEFETSNSPDNLWLKRQGLNFQ